MKLRTVRFIEMRGNDETIHDAMCAHALLQAMGEWWERPSEADSCTDAAVTWIEQRADELMREWTGQ